MDPFGCQAVQQALIQQPLFQAPYLILVICRSCSGSCSPVGWQWKAVRRGWPHPTLQWTRYLGTGVGRLFLERARGGFVGRTAAAAAAQLCCWGAEAAAPWIGPECASVRLHSQNQVADRFGPKVPNSAGSSLHKLRLFLTFLKFV